MYLGISEGKLTTPSRLLAQPDLFHDLLLNVGCCIEQAQWLLEQPCPHLRIDSQLRK